jgi:hypothetical protein
MPPKKKAKKSPKEPEDPLEYINYVREKAEKSFAAKGKKSNINYDIEQNVREIRALLKINTEIFDRCKSSGDFSQQGNSSATFTRYGYEVVKVRQSTPGKVQFITEPEKTQKTFDMTPLSVLPTGLDDIFVAKYQNEYPSFIDFDKFFQTLIMLDDDILEPCLAKLKQPRINSCMFGRNRVLVVRAKE